MIFDFFELDLSLSEQWAKLDLLDMAEVVQSHFGGFRHFVNHRFDLDIIELGQLADVVDLCHTSAYVVRVVHYIETRCQVLGRRAIQAPVDREYGQSYVEVFFGVIRGLLCAKLGSNLLIVNLMSPSPSTCCFSTLRVFVKVSLEGLFRKNRFPRMMIRSALLLAVCSVSYNTW